MAKRKMARRSKVAKQARRANSARSGNRARSARASSSRQRGSDAVALLKQDHQQVSKLFDAFEKAGAGRKAQIAEEVCRMLTVHAQIEEELLYPAARTALEDDDVELVDEAAVEHATAKDLIGQIESARGGGPLFEAKVKVLGEYIRHHVREEEGELFPKLRRSDLDLRELGSQLASRKAELMGTSGGISGGRSSMMMDEDEELVEGSDAGREGPGRQGSARSGSRSPGRSAE